MEELREAASRQQRLAAQHAALAAALEGELKLLRGDVGDLRGQVEQYEAQGTIPPLLCLIQCLHY